MSRPVTRLLARSIALIGAMTVALLCASSLAAQDAPATLDPAVVVADPDVRRFAISIADDGEQRIVLEAHVYEEASADWGAPSCWEELWIDDPALGGACPRRHPLGSAPANAALDLPGRLMVVTNEGACIPELGELVLWNTSVCETSFHVALPISGCPAGAPVAFEIPADAAIQFPERARWAEVTFGEVEISENESYASAEGLPAELQAWWDASNAAIGYDPHRRYMLQGDASLGGTPWHTYSVGWHTIAEGCDDRLATYSGVYRDDAAGSRAARLVPMASDIIYDALSAPLLFLYRGHSLIHVSDARPWPLAAEPAEPLRVMYDNEECASWLGQVFIEANCGL